ncbi:hypothetical protein, partial [Kingella kingae]|uniref:hypothetical protein n=1 Tax=Kingella kingae TaxID=504 RepID=UPI001E2FA71F
ARRFTHATGSSDSVCATAKCVAPVCHQSEHQPHGCSKKIGFHFLFSFKFNMLQKSASKKI